MKHGPFAINKHAWVERQYKRLYERPGKLVLRNTRSFTASSVRAARLHTFLSVSDRAGKFVPQAWSREGAYTRAPLVRGMKPRLNYNLFCKG